MASSFSRMPPMPQPPEDPYAQPQPPQGPQGMMGDPTTAVAPSEAAPNLAPMMNIMSQLSPLANVDSAQAFQIQIRNLDAQIRSVAKQFPAFAPIAEQMMQKLMEGQVLVSATMREPEGPQPMTF